MKSGSNHGIIERNNYEQAASSVQACEKDQEEEFVYYGYRPNAFKQILFYLCVVLSLGTILLLCTWRPKLKIFFTCSMCDLRICKYVLIQDNFKRYFVVKIENFTLNEMNSVRFFIFHMIRYAWNENAQKFLQINGLDQIPTDKLLKDYKGFSVHMQNTQ